MTRRFLGAVQFLTVFPVRGPTVEPGRAAVFFPLAGAIIGWAGGGVFLLFEAWFGAPLAAAAALAFFAIATGAMHEDGLADVADAFRAHRSPSKIMEILKDPRVGAFGAMALIFSVLLRWSAIPGLMTPVLPSFVAAQTLPRTAMVVLAYIARPAGDGMGARFCQQMSAPVTLAATLQAAGAAFWCGLRPGSVLLLITGALVLAAQLYFERRLGGITGDCLGATAQVVEITAFLLLACRSCSW